LQRPQLTNKARVTAVADRAEVLGIKLWEERITIVQVWVMRAQPRFENLTAIKDRFQSPPRGLGVTVVSSQIAQRLFTFEHCRRPNLLGDFPIARHIGAISAPRQSHFHRAGGKSVRLRPNKGELLKPCVLRRFAVAACYSCSHVTSSRAQ